MISFAELLQIELEKSGLNRKQLAEKCGIRSQLISTYLYGQSVPAFDTAIKLLAALNYDFSRLNTEVNTDTIEEYRKLISPEYRLYNNNDGTVSIKYTDIINYKFTLTLQDFTILMVSAIGNADKETAQLKHSSIIAFLNKELQQHMLDGEDKEKALERVAEYIGLEKLDSDDPETLKQIENVLEDIKKGKWPPFEVITALRTIFTPADEPTDEEGALQAEEDPYN